MTAFDTAWAKTGLAEGGYSNNAEDTGGETNHGITINVARAHGYLGAMKDLPLATATAIAKAQYWDVLGLDDVAVVSQAVAAELFDTGFNAGSSVAALFFQKALNLFNREGKDYAQVTEDGHAGKVTAYAFAQYMAKRGSPGETVMLRCLNSQQGAFLMDIGRKRAPDEEFEFGWFLNRVA
jgi:lysozyme family protein